MWSLGAGIVATVGANVAHGLGHGPVGALVSAWPALALVGSFELSMMLIRKHHQADTESEVDATNHLVPELCQGEPPMAQLRSLLGMGTFPRKRALPSSTFRCPRSFGMAM